MNTEEGWRLVDAQGQTEEDARPSTTERRTAKSLVFRSRPLVATKTSSHTAPSSPKDTARTPASFSPRGRGYKTGRSVDESNGTTMNLHSFVMSTSTPQLRRCLAALELEHEKPEEEPEAPLSQSVAFDSEGNRRLMVDVYANQMMMQGRPLSPPKVRRMHACMHVLEPQRA